MRRKRRGRRGRPVGRGHREKHDLLRFSSLRDREVFLFQIAHGLAAGIVDDNADLDEPRRSAEDSRRSELERSLRGVWAPAARARRASLRAPQRARVGVGPHEHNKSPLGDCEKNGDQAVELAHTGTLPDQHISPGAPLELRRAVQPQQPHRPCRRVVDGRGLGDPDELRADRRERDDGDSWRALAFSDRCAPGVAISRDLDPVAAREGPYRRRAGAPAAG